MEDAKNRKEIFMIDASRGYIKDGNKNRLREEDVYKIVKTFNERITDDNSYARLVTYDEIINKNDYNLNLSRYIERNDDEDTQDLDGHINGGIPNTDIDNLHIYFDLFKKLKNKLFKEKRIGFSELNVTKDDIRKTIYQDEEFSKFADVIDTAFKDFQTKTYKKLNNLSTKDDGKKLIFEISEQILKSFAGISLIDKYDVYEVLMEYYNDVMADDIYLIIKEGYKVASEIENIYGTKKEEQDDGKKKEVIDKSKIKGYEGKIIPKSLIIDEYFKKENDLIIDTEVIVENLKAEIETIIDGTDDDSSINDVLNDSGKIDTKKLKKLKDSDNEIKCLYDKYNEVSEKSKVLKELKKELEDKVKAKYKELTLDELKKLTIDKKWYKNIYEGIDNLYMNISHNLTNKVMELADRYDLTLSEIEEDVDNIEKKVKNHIKELMED